MASDFPAITPDRWIRDFEKLDIKPDVRPLIMKESAAHLLRLGSAAGPAEEHGADTGPRNLGLQATAGLGITADRVSGKLAGP